MRSYQVTAIVLFGFTAASCGNLAANDDKIAEILDRCSAGLLQIKSIQCDWSVVGKHEKTDTAPASRGGYAARHYNQAGKFRIEYFWNLASPAGKPDSIQSYDGEKLFNYMKEIDGLNFQTKAADESPSPGPLDNVYHWVYAPGQPKTWVELQRPETWQNALKRARYVGTITEDGRSCEVVEFAMPYPKYPKFKRRVYFQTDLDYFPRKHERLDGETVHASIRAVEHAKVKLGDRTLAIPTEVRRDEFGPLVPKSVSECYLNIDSLKLNAQLDEKLFKISPEGISMVQDNDTLLPK